MIISVYLESAFPATGGLLIADPRLSLAFTGQYKEDMVGDLSVHLPQNRFLQLGLEQAYLKHLNLLYPFPGGNMDSVGRQLVPPINRVDLLLEHQPQSRGNLQFLVKLLLRDAFPKLSAFGEAQHTPTLLFYHKEAN